MLLIPKKRLSGAWLLVGRTLYVWLDHSEGTINKVFYRIHHKEPIDIKLRAVGDGLFEIRLPCCIVDIMNTGYSGGKFAIPSHF